MPGIVCATMDTFRLATGEHRYENRNNFNMIYVVVFSIVKSHYYIG